MIEDTTPIYKQALIEAKKLRELAKREAEKAILSKVSAQIAKMLDEEISGVPMLLEQEDMTNLPTGNELGANAANPKMPAVAPINTTPVPPTGDMATATLTPPINPTDSYMKTDTDMNTTSNMQEPSQLPVSTPVKEGDLEIPMIGADGKITVDIEKLFAATPEGSEPNISAATITPVSSTNVPMEPEAGEPANIVAESFKSYLKLLEKDFHKYKKSGVGKEILKNKILTLYEISKIARENKEIPEKTIAIAEAAMELMFQDLKKTDEEQNIYKTKNKKEESEMSKKSLQSLEEYARSLFEESESKGHTGFGDGDSIDWGIKNTTTLDDDYAMKKSSRYFDDIEDLDKKKHSELCESEDPQLEAELIEMLKNIDSDVSDDSDLSMKKERLEKKLSEIKKQERKIKKELKECGMMDDTSETPVNVNLKITVDKDGEVSSVKLHDDDDDDEKEFWSKASTYKEYSKPRRHRDDDHDDDDMEIEIVPDEEDEKDKSEKHDSLKHVSDDDDVLDDDDDVLDDDDDDSDDDDVLDDDDDVLDDDDVKKVKSKKEVVTESKIAKENRILRRRLAEQQFLSAISIYTAKLFAEHNLSTNAKRKIVKYLDSAQDLQELKSKYLKVKRMLEEGTRPISSFGSSSKPGTFLTEAVTAMNLTLNPNRWMQLAGIVKKSK
jgi:hypothetical protein